MSGNAFANFGRPHRGKVLPATIIEQKNKQNSAIPHHHFPADMAGNLTSGGFVMNFVDYSLNDLNNTEGKTGVAGASDVLESFLLPLPGQGIEDKQAVKFINNTLRLCDTQGGGILKLNDSRSINCDIENNAGNINAMNNVFINYFVSFFICVD